MKVVRIYTGSDQQSQFEDLDIPYSQSHIGGLTAPATAHTVFFRDTALGGPEVYDFHVAPRRQFVIHLAGRVEIEVGDGTKRQFGVGDVLLADDTTGQGHISREVQGPRVQVFVTLPAELDLGPWGAKA